jgi:hypothetical protein
MEQQRSKSISSNFTWTKVWAIFVVVVFVSALVVAYLEIKYLYFKRSATNQVAIYFNKKK